MYICDKMLMCKCKQYIIYIDLYPGPGYRHTYIDSRYIIVVVEQNKTVQCGSVMHT